MLLFITTNTLNYLCFFGSKKSHTMVSQLMVLKYLSHFFFLHLHLFSTQVLTFVYMFLLQEEYEKKISQLMLLVVLVHKHLV